MVLNNLSRSMKSFINKFNQSLVSLACIKPGRGGASHITPQIERKCAVHSARGANDVGKAFGLTENSLLLA